VTMQNPAHQTFLRYLLRNIEFREYMTISEMIPLHEVMTQKFLEHSVPVISNGVGGNS
jgi:hypothetical protein